MFCQIAISFHSKEYYNAIGKRKHIGVSGITEPERTDSVPEEPSQQPYSPTLPQLTRLKSDPDDQQEDTEEEDQQSSQPDNQTLLRLLEENEKVVLAPEGLICL